jgi:hypothetical protein
VRIVSLVGRPHRTAPQPGSDVRATSARCTGWRRSSWGRGRAPGRHCGVTRSIGRGGDPTRDRMALVRPHSGTSDEMVVVIRVRASAAGVTSATETRVLIGAGAKLPIARAGIRTPCEGALTRLADLNEVIHSPQGPPG